jgi:flagellar hook protein FlgE
MTNALLSGLTGLRANQNYLDVIGNNLANSNTPGYKSSRVTFSDILSQTLRPASGPSSRLGGTNPLQLGRGAVISSIDQNFAQGSLLTTGRTLDLGVQGNGFFVLSDGNEQFFTRVGAFGLDSQENLVDLRSGLRVQSNTGDDIQLRLNSVVPPSGTSKISFRGNLPAPGPESGPTIEKLETEPYMEAHPAVVTSPPPAGPGGTYVLTSGDQMILAFNLSSSQTITFTSSQFANIAAATPAEVAAAINGQIQDGVASVGAAGEIIITANSSGNSSRIQISSSPPAINIPAGTSLGSEQVATAATALNSLKGNSTDYVTGDRIRIFGAKGSSIVDITFTYGTDGTTLGQLIAFANNAYQPEATLTLQPDGKLVLEATNQGPIDLALTFQDGTGAAQIGQTNFALNQLIVTVPGRAPDTQDAIVSVYDSLGTLHTVTFTYERQLNGKWNLTASVDPGEGTIANPTVASLEFGPDGGLPAAVATTLDVTWAGAAAPQSIGLDFGVPGSFDGLTQFGSSGDVFGDSDGYQAGSLSSIGVRSDGTIEGFYTNGQIQSLAQLQMAVFTNPAGLERGGNGLLRVSSNSGVAQLAMAGNGSAGIVVSGSLEGSNVDVAEEFVRLIEAQRGFQANARIISTTDQVLAELVNLGR